MADPAVLLSLRNELRACELCNLRKTAREPIPWSGDTGADILVIGEAPGEREDKEGEPFIGSAGQLLRAKLRESGLWAVAKFAFANSCSCYPGRGLSDRQDIAYINTCRRWMRAQVAAIQPQFILTVGVVAYRSVFENAASWPTLQQVHGKPLYWPNPPAPAHPAAVWSTYHPSAALRSGKYKRILLEDLQALKKWVDEGEDWPTNCYICGDPEFENIDEEGRGIYLCAKHRMRQQELALK